MVGALLYIYAANSQSPVVVYKNIGLSPGQEHQWPIVADANGRIPAFWLADGSYHAKLTDAMGNIQFDEQSITAMGPSTGSLPVTVPSEQLATTGDVKWAPTSDDLTGWLKMNGATIGPSGSGATLTGSIYQALFEWIYNRIDQNICPVTPNRTGNSTSDWSSGTRKIQLIDMRGKCPFGLDGMGSSVAGNLPSGSNGVPVGGGAAAGLVTGTGGVNVNGSTVGGSIHTLAAAQLPSHQHVAFIRDPQHSHVGAQTGAQSGSGVSNLLQSSAGTLGISQLASTNVRVNSDNLANPANDDKTGDVSVTHSGAHNNTSLGVLGTWYWKL